MGLHVQRKPGQYIVLEINGVEITITYHEFYKHGRQIKLVLEGPKDKIKFTRGEIYEGIKKKCSNSSL